MAYFCQLPALFIDFADNLKSIPNTPSFSCTGMDAHSGAFGTRHLSWALASCRVEKGGAIGLIQILPKGLCHAGGAHFLVHIPLPWSENGYHPPVAVDIEDLHPDRFLVDQKGTAFH